jgi:hypothetical protein
MVALSLYPLARSESFAAARRSLGLGVIVGLGMLTKPPFAIYVVPPSGISGAPCGRRIAAGGSVGRRPLSPWVRLSPYYVTGPASLAFPCRSPAAPRDPFS